MKFHIINNSAAAAAAAESLQSCLTLCDPIDSSPPGSLVPGILQARTLEWVAIDNSFIIYDKNVPSEFLSTLFMYIGICKKVRNTFIKWD